MRRRPAGRDMICFDGTVCCEFGTRISCIGGVLTDHCDTDY